MRCNHGLHLEPLAAPWLCRNVIPNSQMQVKEEEECLDGEKGVGYQCPIMTVTADKTG